MKKSINDNPQVQKWLNDPNYQAWSRQIGTDMMTGRKFGVSKQELKETFQQLLKKVEDNYKALWT